MSRAGRTPSTAWCAGPTGLRSPTTPIRSPCRVRYDSSGDFTEGRQIATTQLDTAYGELVRGGDGRAVARPTDPVSGRSVELWVDEGYRYLMVYTADQVSQPGRRRTAVAIEPMTCPPDALRSGVDLIELDPGETWQGSWGLRQESSRT